MAFYRQYNMVMGKIKNGKTPQKTLLDVNLYFDYQWSLYKGLDIDEMTAHMPEVIKSDILLSRYQDTVESSLLFREEKGQIDVAMAGSIFKKMKISVYSSQEYIMKVGQHTTDTFIFLDGHVQVYGMFGNESLGILSTGSHFGNDLAGDNTQISLMKIVSNESSKIKMDSINDNFKDKSLVHLVANSFVVVGCLSKSDREILYQAYPKWKSMMQTINRFLFELAKRSLESHMTSNDKQPSRQHCASEIQNHISYSDEETYESIIEQELYTTYESTDLTRMLKHHYIQSVTLQMTQ